MITIGCYTTMNSGPIVFILFEPYLPYNIYIFCSYLKVYRIMKTTVYDPVERKMGKFFDTVYFLPFYSVMSLCYFQYF